MSASEHFKTSTEALILAYFDTNKEVVLQVDSSKNGVGAVLLQDGKPVEFASRALARLLPCSYRNTLGSELPLTF
jgi:hypothetical protein